MKYLLILAASGVIATINPQLAILFWVISIAVEHAVEETRGRLWAYFGEFTGLKSLARLNPWIGAALIVLPALLLQGVAAAFAFGGASINLFWLALLIGARAGDALFSHQLPRILGAKAQEDLDGKITQSNPGYASALIYAADSILLLLLALKLEPTLSNQTTVGFALGAGFFAAVQPSLRLIAHLVPSLRK